MLSNGTGFEYGIPLNTWKSLGGSVFVSKTRGLGAATDPDAGYVYIPNGYVTNGTIQMIQYDIVNNLLKGVPMHPLLAATASYAVSWSAQAKKMIVFGGSTTGTNNVNNFLYTWDSVNLWVAVDLKGSGVPTARRSACMVPAYNGAKMVLFGGLTDQSNSVLSDIYILDTTTMTWTRGADAGVASARAEAACAITNDLFVAWGGGGVNTVITSNLTVVYNIKRDVWQSTYSPTSDPGSDGSSGGGNGHGGDGSNGGGGSSSLGAIIGGAVGGLAVIALAVGLLLYRRRQNRKVKTPVAPTQQIQNQHTTTGSPLTTLGPGAGGAYLQGDPWQQPQPQPQLMQQGQQQQPIIFSQAPYSQPYTPYQPPIVHDYQQQQPLIFQPHQSLYDDKYQPQLQQQNLYLPANTTSLYNPHIDIHQQQPTVYQPTPEATYSSVSASASAASPSFEQQAKPETPTTPTPFARPPQNPQLMNVSDSYTDDDSPRRGPQGV
ncbi:hypothetical protein EDD11_003936 [Mortierella claussenii]|nr:hypothetical protein EDD11_003936 [Mortierella claussenii]